MIKIVDLTKIYGKESDENKVVAVNQVNLEIKKAEFVAIMGESGSGKSTLLNLIAGFQKPTSGDIFYNDINIAKLNNNKLADYRRENLGFVFQDFVLEPDFTVLQNMELPLIIDGVQKNERRSRSKTVLEEFGLLEKQDSLVKNLSGGQKQRLCIARAILRNPAIVLADEPTGNLDSKNGGIIVDLLKSLTKRGTTVVMVTHNQIEAKKCDRIVEIKDGEIVGTNEVER